MTVDLDELERLEKAAGDSPCQMVPNPINPQWPEMMAGSAHYVALRNAAPALIARARDADRLEAENATLRSRLAAIEAKMAGAREAVEKAGIVLPVRVEDHDLYDEIDEWVAEAGTVEQALAIVAALNLLHGGEDAD
jgi:hypothetical protein